MLKNLNKRRNLLGTIYAIFMLMPLLSVLVTCIYVQLNHNAFESYYGTTINEVVYAPVDNANQLFVGESYHFERPLEHKTLTNSSTYYIKFNNVRNLNSNFTQTIDISTFDAMRMSDYTSNYLILLDSATNTQVYTISLSTYNISFDFDFVDYSYNLTNSLTSYYDSTITRITYNRYSYLDNAFDYSIYRVTNGNRGNIDFTSSLFSFFLSSNEVNNLYIGFINYYINYTLLVSCIYFLYLVLMWFITFIKNLIFRYMGE